MADQEDQLSRPNPTTAYSARSTPSPAHSPHSSPETTMTTPEQSLGDDDGDDIWDTSSDHEYASHAAAQGSDFQAQLPADSSVREQERDLSHRIRREVILSDIPSLRRQHMTDGYREGLSVGKAQVMQSGFDAGYPLGVEVGLRVGKVLGVLEGIISALTTKSRLIGKTPEVGSSSSTVTTTTPAPSSAESPIYGVVDRDERGRDNSAGKRDGSLSFVQTLHARAQRELKVSELLKSLDDEKIAAIPEARAGEEGGPGGEKNMNVEVVAVPAEIEAVLGKWEQIVLGGLRKRGSKEDEDEDRR